MTTTIAEYDIFRRFRSLLHEVFSSGISERSLVFKPGFEVDGEIVGRTFQPAYVVARDGVLITFCQGRLWGGSDDEGRTWCHKVVEAASFSYSTVGFLKRAQYITFSPAIPWARMASGAGYLRTTG